MIKTTMGLLMALFLFGCTKTDTPIPHKQITEDTCQGYWIFGNRELMVELYLPGAMAVEQVPFDSYVVGDTVYLKMYKDSSAVDFKFYYEGDHLKSKWFRPFLANNQIITGTKK